MKRICLLAICLAAVSALLLCPAHADAAGTTKAPSRGIAVLASSIGTDLSPEQLADFVKQGKFSTVVVDWAWVTYHWGNTDFKAVNRFLDLMAARNVPVAAMYRPRFISGPTVPTQIGRDGKPGVDHAEICYSDASARKWGASWGVKILEKCPRIKEIIIYNPTDMCGCPKCLAARASGPNTAVVKFLSEAKSAWQAKRPGTKLGVVSMPDAGFWKASLAVIDVAHPYLCIREEIDAAKEIADIKAMQSIVKQKMGSCLAKITWEEDAKVSMAKLKSVDELASKQGVSYFFWTFDTLFRSPLYDPRDVAHALNIGLPKTALVGRAPAKLASAAPAAARTVETSLPGGSTAGENMYTPEQIKSTPAEVFLARMAQPEPGYWQFAAMNALAQKAKEADPKTRGLILSMVTAAMYDRNRTEFQRFQCCYVLRDSGDEQVIPDLIRVLLNDPSETMRSVAAESLGRFYSNTKAYNALVQAARQETSPKVREVLAKYLNQGPPPSGGTGPINGGGNGGGNNGGNGGGTGSITGGGPAGERMYSPEQIASMSPETFLERMAAPEAGYWRFAALNALSQKAIDSSPEIRRAILSMVTAAMYDKTRTEYQRFQCCYVLSGSKDEQVVPDLIQVLFYDPSETMRSVAVEALADFPNCSAAHEALLKAAREETSPMVREVLARRLGQVLPPVTPVTPPVNELAPGGSPQPPIGPARPVSQSLPWPFPGDSEAQNIFNNYQTATNDYIHCGLDFIHPAGTPVTAVGSGYVAVIATNYPDWITHHFFIVTPEKGGNRGWCYTHMDPRTFTFKQGDYIKQGQVLGKLVKFSVGSMPGMDHLHLHYVSFTRNASGNIDVHSLLDPLYYFDWKDTEAPSLLPLWFVPDGSLQPFRPDATGVVTVKGKVDILAAITDRAYPSNQAYLGVPVVMLSISDGTHTMQKLVLDHRADVGDERQTKPLYLSREDGKALANPGSFFPFYQVLRVTKTDGDGKITPADAAECWNTTARDANGKFLWPNGKYSVNVYAWDIAGNRGCVGAIVQVKN